MTACGRRHRRSDHGDAADARRPAGALWYIWRGEAVIVFVFRHNRKRDVRARGFDAPFIS